MNTILIFFNILLFCVICDSRYRLYHTHYSLSNNDHDCLYRFENSSNDLARHLISYCIRHSLVDINKTCFGNQYTYAELRSSNITPLLLFQWFAPIDLIDDYATYLLINSVDNTNEKIFCNCTNNRSFGLYCQYEFVLGKKENSFDEIVQKTLKESILNKDDLYLMNEQNSSTCYTLMNCTTYSNICLDWREINDGVIHCKNGEDEQYFEIMELNECNNEKEYRCRNGLCIPRNFLLDRTYDCPDWYDEQSDRIRTVDLTDTCSTNIRTSECEEYRLGLNFFSCGDGQRLSLEDRSPPHCANFRDALMIKALFRPYLNQMLTNSCHSTLMCYLHIYCLFYPCHNGLSDHCEALTNLYSNHSCPDRFFFPPGPFFYPFIRLLYQASQIGDSSYPDFICWNQSMCNIYSNSSGFLFNDFYCVERHYFSINTFSSDKEFKDITLFIFIIQILFSYCHQQQTSHSSLFICSTQMKISFHRLGDNRYHDCIPWRIFIEDEDDKSITEKMTCHLPDRYPCRSQKCFPRRILHDGFTDCIGSTDEIFPSGCTEEVDCQYTREYDLKQIPPIVYQLLCDGFQEFEPQYLHGDSNDTDETDCEKWPCYNRYHHCNGYWNRPNGCDELNCNSLLNSSIHTCAPNEHPCAYFNSTTIGCLPVEKAGDYHIDCLFGTDERITLLTRRTEGTVDIENRPTFVFSYILICWNHFNITIRPYDICNGIIDCPLGDDELFCNWLDNSTWDTYQEYICKNGSSIPKNNWCDGIIDCKPDGEDERLCDVLLPRIGILSHIAKIVPSEFSFDNIHAIEARSLSSTPKKIHCYRGIMIKNRITGNYGCLCPSSYYGIYCEMQSERLTIFYRIETPPMFEQNSIYRLVFYLFDENEQILSYETMTYAVFNKELSLKHLIYLNYPRLMNSQSAIGKKFVRIDAYQVTNHSIELTPLSWFYEVEFSKFLPVTRLSILLYLEESTRNRTARCQELTHCEHGHCQLFINSNEPFCHCDEGWFGSMCNRKISIELCQTLNCNQTFSKCIVYNNHAFCLCALGRIGPKCQVPFNTCSSIKYLNNGTCVNLDERTISHICVCPSPYFGDICQYESAQLKLNIPTNLSRVLVMNIHFLHTTDTVLGTLLHRNLFIFRNIQVNSQLIIIDINQSFLPSFIIAQLFFTSTSYYGSYYLIELSNNMRKNLTTQIENKYRCPHVNEYLNSTLINQNWLKRIKFYHQYMKNVRCFHDEIYFCIVDKYEIPDCLIYNHGIANCTERNYCENNGRCLQRKQLGHLDYACVCPQCTTGTFCQIQMTQFSLTLDSILGQTILINTSLKNQPSIIKIIFALIIFMFIIGLISNFCSALTFRHKTIKKNGCGWYLFILSIINQITLGLFLTRIIYLICSSSMKINNQQFLKVNCLLFDYILQVCVSLCDWLTACVACERTVSVYKGVNFNNKQSVRAVKFVIPSLTIILILTSLHQVFTHVLIVDPQSDDHFWCVIKYQFIWLRTYELFINILNNFIPFIINLSAACLFLIKYSVIRQRTAVNTEYRTILLTHLKEYKRLFIAPLVMIIAKLPLLIILLTIKCITEQWHLYISLVAYGLSILPLTSTFITVVWPIASYMENFKEQSRWFRKKMKINILK